MKKIILASLFICFSNCLFSQVLEGNSVVWHPYSQDARVKFTFYTKGIMAGSVESGELLIENTTSHKLLVKLTYNLSDYCKNAAKVFHKSEVLEPNGSSKSSGAFFSGIDYTTECKEVKKLSESRSTKISYIGIQIESIEDITDKEEEAERKKEKENKERKQKEKEEDVKKKEEEAKKKLNEERTQKELDDKRIANEEEAKIKKEFEKKELEAKNISDEEERVAALNKIEKEKLSQEKKAIDKKAEKVLTEEDKEASYLEFQRKQKENQAKILEKEGDNLKALGSIFMDAALKKYEEAQMQYYSGIVQTKIDKILATKQAVKLINEGMEKVDEFASDMQNTMDEAGLPRWRVASFWYDGFAPGFKGFKTQKVVVPQTISFTYGFYRIFAMEVGFNYEKSPVYKFGLEDNNNKYIGKDVEANYTAVGPEVSIGLALGSNNVAIFGLYGYYFPFIINATTHSSEYNFDKNFKDNFAPTAISKLKFGFFANIPKSRIGIGVKYTFNRVNGEKLMKGGSETITDINNQKYGTGPGNYNSYDKLKYNTIAVSFIIKSK